MDEDGLPVWIHRGKTNTRCLFVGVGKMENRKLKREKGWFKKGKSGKPLFWGQVTIEFTVTMVFTVLLILGMIRIFAWTGRELVERRKAHELILTQPICGSSSCPLSQIRPTFFRGASFNAAVSSNIFGTN